MLANENQDSIPPHQPPPKERLLGQGPLPFGTTPVIHSILE
jgi:hypothetical protein